MNNLNQSGEEPDYTIKILLLGDLSVGKTSFIYNFIYNEFKSEEISTSELELKQSDIIIEHKKIRVQLWDTAGQEKYKSIANNLILKSQGIIIMYDITNKESYKNIQTWINLVNEKNGNNKLPILIVGNKIDLEDKRIISKEEGKKFSKNKNYKFIETSCLNGHNIKKAITRICKFIITKQNFKKDISFSLSTSDINGNKKKHCC